MGCRDFGGVGEIRTLEALNTPTRFPVVLVMTTSILLQISNAGRSRGRSVSLLETAPLSYTKLRHLSSPNLSVDCRSADLQNLCGDRRGHCAARAAVFHEHDERQRTILIHAEAREHRVRRLPLVLRRAKLRPHLPRGDPMAGRRFSPALSGQVGRHI